MHERINCWFSYITRHAPASCGARAAEIGEQSSLPFLHTWKLERLFSLVSSSGKMWDYSGVFLAGGYEWKLALRSSELEAQEGKGFLSLFLVLVGVDATPSPDHIEVLVESSILHENYSQCCKRKVIHRFRQSKSGEERHPYLFSLETLECPSPGFLVAEIIDVVFLSKENASLSPKLEDNSLAYTWKIDGFSKLTKQSYTSGPFLYKGHIWYLELYPKGKLEEKDKSISLFLYLDDASTLPSSVEMRAELYIELVDQIEGKNHQRRGSMVFAQKSPGWGWSKFLSLDALYEPSKGLLVNDTCIIKVGFCKCDISK